jgi:poly(3-hydroxybutyrate) depolymerase
MLRRINIQCVVLALPLAFAGRLTAAQQPAEIPIVDSFETGMDAPEGWEQGATVPGVKYLYDHHVASEGKRSLSLQKSAKRYFPIAGWSRTFNHTGDKPALKVAAEVKASKATKAIIDVQFLDADGNWIKHDWVAYIGQKNPSDSVATHDWKTYDGALEIPAGAKKIGISLQIYGPGSVWFDELQIRYADSVTGAKTIDSKASTEPSAPGGEALEIPPPIKVKVASGRVAQYLLIPPRDDVEKPKSGYPLLLVLPGGDGSADFHPFIRSVHEQALDGRFVVAQPLAPPHTVWPTESSTARPATTEESIGAIIDDVAKRHSIDRQHVHAMAWSSSGPAIYATLLQDHSPLAGALIAMSVFKRVELPPLENAAGRRVYLLHSPTDSVTPYRMAQQAKEQLASSGAEVTLVEYDGGHGWHGPVFDNIRAGMAWLNRAATCSESAAR